MKKKILTGFLTPAIIAGIAATPALAQNSPAAQDHLQKQNIDAVFMASASISEKNRKADQLYKETAQTIAQQHPGTYYACADIVGNSLHEGLFLDDSASGSSWRFQIFSCRNGKLTSILNTENYGMDAIQAYKKSKSLIIYCAGHGGEHYDYYKMKKGKYVKVAEKARSMFPSGGSWNYYGSGTKKISKKSFRAKTGKIKQGSRKTLKVVNWTRV